MDDRARPIDNETGQKMPLKLNAPSIFDLFLCLLQVFDQ